MNEKKIYALGFFDGVHLGHQALLEKTRQLAGALGCRCSAVTFDLPPHSVLRQKNPLMITTLQYRLSLLRSFGMDDVLVLNADNETLSTPWRSFLDRLPDCAGFVCGEDFRFGHRGEGDAPKLQQYAAEQGLCCAIVPQQDLEGERISSTRIRLLLEQGEIEKANQLLGHPYALTGTVQPGHQLGRTLGLPTANLLLPNELLKPAFGVYCCRATVEGKCYSAVTNIGVRPTVSGNGITVESILLDFEGDLYGKELHLDFFHFLRPEKKFNSLPDLQQEIRKNREETRKFFENM